MSKKGHYYRRGQNRGQRELLTDTSFPADAIDIYTDGACWPNPGPGGWAALICTPGERTMLRGRAPATTNNRMELSGPLEALRSLEKTTAVRIYSDSRYVVDGMSSWLRGWKRKGWRTKSGEPVKNEDLWRELDEQAQRHRVQWNWIKGHAGHPENELCDQAANEMAANCLGDLAHEALDREMAERIAREA